ncbi:MAG: hypothetical protein AAB340_02830 [Patescibacteria group bacterium]
MEKWEYKVLRFMGDERYDEKVVEEKLNALGQEGYRVIHAFEGGSVLMEREIPEKAREKFPS